MQVIISHAWFKMADKFHTHSYDRISAFVRALCVRACATYRLQLSDRVYPKHTIQPLRRRLPQDHLETMHD